MQPKPQRQFTVEELNEMVETAARFAGRTADLYQFPHTVFWKPDPSFPFHFLPALAPDLTESEARGWKLVVTMLPATWWESPAIRNKVAKRKD